MLCTLLEAALLHGFQDTGIKVHLGSFLFSFIPFLLLPFLHSSFLPSLLPSFLFFHACFLPPFLLPQTQSLLWRGGGGGKRKRKELGSKAPWEGIRRDRKGTREGRREEEKCFPSFSLCSFALFAFSSSPPPSLPL